MESRAQWRGWLAEHASTSPGVWVVTWKRSSGRPVLAYEDLVQEALCFGWVDGQARAVDAERTSLLVTPRRPGSGWARTNEERVARLQAAGLAAALDADPAARAAWDGFPPSARKQLIAWVTTAKRPETRARRVNETAARAARGERANQ
ncbi:MAG: hypothetical protein EPN99_10290 [Frankiales bacterium]|nr:MAG: hypothetical protein EPN99_10290 [Frankiales bacterium]